MKACRNCFAWSWQLLLDERELPYPRRRLAQDDAVFLGELNEPLRGAVEWVCVGWMGYSHGCKLGRLRRFVFTATARLSGISASQPSSPMH